mmetsp:Transcript_17008/g.21692  ORF Transcript_17008/g.21692 Transcript_17008/m.21692 type:complete len:220 (-) Transcript_17008:1372-2031(-)
MSDVITSEQPLTRMVGEAMPLERMSNVFKYSSVRSGSLGGSAIGKKTIPALYECLVISWLKMEHLLSCGISSRKALFSSSFVSSCVNFSSSKSNTRIRASMRQYSIKPDNISFASCCLDAVEMVMILKLVCSLQNLVLERIQPNNTAIVMLGQLILESSTDGSTAQQSILFLFPPASLRDQRETFAPPANEASLKRLKFLAIRTFFSNNKARLIHAKYS